ncbi:hypothetical protein HOY80DRAFT_1059421 [Tuber brumale]|nr:hypothetical protein HOY80DRAFT_1059421 [Tuber brumale]
MSPDSTNIGTPYMKDTAQKQLLDLLVTVRGKKTIILDKSLSGPVGLFCKLSALQARCFITYRGGEGIDLIKQDHGVDKIFWLEQNAVAAVTQKNIAFLKSLISFRLALICPDGTYTGLYNALSHSTASLSAKIYHVLISDSPEVCAPSPSPANREWTALDKDGPIPID